jgi:hypothetical protein
VNCREALIPLTSVLVMSAIALATAQQGAGERRPRETPSDVEEIYVFRSFSERTEAGETEFCKRAAPFRSTSHNYYSLWSVAGDERSGRLTDVRRMRIGELHNCVGDANGTLQFYTVGTINGITFRGRGDQRAEQQTAAINSRVNRFLLEGLPTPYVAGVLSSNTVRTTPPDASGYVQSSVGVIRLWRNR